MDKIILFLKILVELCRLKAKNHDVSNRSGTANYTGTVAYTTMRKAPERGALLLWWQKGCG
jgi:hypothetical protein